MRECLSEVMGISPARVSVKATTTERLGFVGRKEGCEVWAIVLIERK
jgi:2-C-methyl-D-erythritol 2,4-cyclodiphosphate synthase